MLSTVMPQRSTHKQGRHAGQVVIMAALGMIVLLGFVALSVDVGYALSQRRGLQTAADASALAVAEAVLAGTTNQTVMDNTANSYTTGNGFPDADVSVDLGGTSTSKTVTVDLTSDVPKFFIGAVYHGNWKVHARAVATIDSQPGNYGLLVLDQTGYPASFTGNSDVNVIDGGAMSNAGMQCKGNSRIHADETMDAAKGFSTTGNCGFSGTKGSNPSAAIVPDPLANVPAPPLPSTPQISGPVTCSKSGSNYTCPAGVINQSYSVNGGTITFSAGNHEIDNATISGGGNGSTIVLNPGTYYFHSSSLTFSGNNPSLVFKPGSYMFYMDNGNMSFNGNSKGFDFSNVNVEFYFKNSNVSFSGNTNGSIPPGIYYFDGKGPNLSGNKKVTGDSVLFFFDNGATFDTTGNTEYNFTAAATSLYPHGQTGVVMYSARGSTGTFQMQGNSSSFLGGVVYLPSATLQLGGNPSGTWAEGQLIVDQVTNNGNPDITIKYKNYVDISEPKIFLTQ